jgi:hypothetical protein
MLQSSFENKKSREVFSPRPLKTKNRGVFCLPTVIFALQVVLVSAHPKQTGIKKIPIIKIIPARYIMHHQFPLF